MRAGAEHVGRRLDRTCEHLSAPGLFTAVQGCGPFRAGCVVTLVGALLWFCGTAWSGEEKSQQKKKFPHPHAVHLEIVQQSTPEFTIEDIANWPEFLRSFLGKLSLFSVGPEVRRMASLARPEAIAADEKTILVEELNRLLGQPNAGVRGKPATPTSAETKKAAARYRKTGDPDDLKWLRRNLINDVFPQLARKARESEVPPITCVTCHESYAPVEKSGAEAPPAPAADEKAVAECFLNAVAGGQSPKECLLRADALRAARIESYGPPVGFVQKNPTEGEIAFITAMRPENPYTFKPLLKRLVCTQCHGYGRTVDKVKSRDGKMKEIPLFFGSGFRQVRPEDVADVQAR
jgi:hypothetical protein